MKSILLLVFGFFFGIASFAQLGGAGHANLIGDYVNISVNGERGHEGTDDIFAGFNQRAPGTRCGFVADPHLTGWDPLGHTGDFFMPGAREKGWGLKDGGVAYSNNYNIYEVAFDAGSVISHVVEGDCITVEWQGTTPSGLIVNIKYHLVEDELFYTTEVTIINTTVTDKTDLYYYRNVDPDNDQTLSGSYSTFNTIVSQPDGDCQKALVSAEQFTPHDSYLGFGALGPDWRVSYGGFSNRDGEDIWNGTGFEDGVGVSSDGDVGISIAYKTDILAGDTANFTFAVVLSEDAVENAFSSLYYIDYSSIGGDGGGLINQCNPLVDTAQSCAGNDVTLSVDGPNADDYTWVWTSMPFDPDADTDGPIIVVSPGVTTTYTVVGTPISDCLVSTISKTIVVEFTEGPDLSVTDPGSFCEEFDITTLVWEDLNDTDDLVSYFFSECPDSATQVEPIYDGPLMGPDDEVWLMIGDTAGGCFDKVLVEIDFGGLDAAGADSTIALCGEAGMIVDLNDLIEAGANPLGDFEEVTASGQFNAATGELNVGGLGGTYVFTYTVLGVAPCPDDDATFTVEVYPQPIADFEYIVGGVSSADGLGSTCIINTVDFVDFSTIPVGGTITSWDWDFGGDGTSTLEDPSHLFTTTGTFIISLTVTTDDGCTDTFTKEIVIYTEPILDVIFNEPTCFGFSDGSITAFVAGGSGTFDIEIMHDGPDTLVNSPGTNTANTLSAGTYTVTVMDGSGCTATTTVTLVDPLPLDAFYTVVPPLCYGDSGYITIDSVVGMAINNVMAYFWAPVTDVPNGFNADSVNVLAGDYVVTINDSKGCSNVVTITMTEPDELTATVDYEPAYCRLYNYQSGSGVVYAAGAGGTGDPSTPHWVYLDDPEPPLDEADQGTWGGRNPGRYEVTITDDNGCVFVDTILVDSLNPIADFTVTSDQLNEDCKGTAQVDVIFTNTSLYFANPNNPLADTTFFWNLDTLNTDDYIVHTYEYAPDSSYTAKGQTYDVEVCLIAFNKNGCWDEKCKTLTIFEPIAFPDVNIFSPNGDGINDEFTFEWKSASISTLECVIVNRWGIKVGEITEPDGSWDGTDMNGDPCNDGVYFYVFTAGADNGEKLEGHGSLQIINSKE